MRRFHINRFPQDRIYVLLDRSFHNELFGFIKDNYKFQGFNNKHFSGSLNWHTYKVWKRRNSPFNKTHKVTFIPLWFVVTISEKFKDRFPIERIEKKIIGFHGPSSSKVIWNPKLPLVEDGRLLKILSHLIGDGFIGGGFGSKLPNGKGSSEYRNFNKGLLDQFSKDLSVFGDIKIHIDYKTGHLNVPNSIGYMIKHIYKIETDSFRSRVPKEIYNLDRRIVSSFIRGFGDDEGHVYDNHIDLYSVNKLLLLDIMRLFKEKFPEIEISTLKRNDYNKNPKYYFYVLSKSREEYLKLIGFDHDEKRKDLLFNINRVKTKKIGVRGESKRRILEYLKEKHLTSKQLSRLIGISHDVTIGHLNRLERDNLVHVTGKGLRNDKIWTSNSKFSML